MKKLIVISIVLILVLALVTLLQGNSILTSSNTYNHGYWNAENMYLNRRIF